MVGGQDASGQGSMARAAAGLRFSQPGGGIAGSLVRMPWGLVTLIVAVAVIGTAMLYSVTHQDATEARLPINHMVRFMVAFAVMLAVALVPLRIWLRLSLPAYVASLLLLMGVELAGAIRGGAQRWLEVGPVVVQPSEFMKLALILALARYYHATTLRKGRGLLVHLPAALMILVPAALIFRQPDFGTTLALIASGGLVVFLAGLDWRIIFAGAFVSAAAIVPVYHVVLEEYQRQRVDTFLEQMTGGASDALGSSYQIEQAKVAIGSGGLRGKGYLEGTQSQLDYIPEQHTDFILTVIAEELGFLGTAGLMILWGVILGWALMIATRSASAFGRFAAAGATATIAFYIVFNVGMVVGLLPVVGVPMPLVSYGGTAMLTVMGAFGLILAVALNSDETLPSV